MPEHLTEKSAVRRKKEALLEAESCEGVCDGGKSVAKRPMVVASVGWC